MSVLSLSHPGNLNSKLCLTSVDQNENDFDALPKSKLSVFMTISLKDLTRDFDGALEYSRICFLIWCLTARATISVISNFFKCSDLTWYLTCPKYRMLMPLRCISTINRSNVSLPGSVSVLISIKVLLVLIKIFLLASNFLRFADCCSESSLKSSCDDSRGLFFVKLAMCASSRLAANFGMISVSSR